MKNIPMHLCALPLLCAGVLLGTMGWAQSPYEFVVPISGNTWQSPVETRALSRTEGIKHWDKNSDFTTYVRFGSPGEMRLQIELGAVKEASSFRLAAGKFSKTLHIGPEQAHSRVMVGLVSVPSSDDDKVLPEIKDLIITSETVFLSESRCVASNEDNYFYWGRRGPSVHLAYSVPTDADVEYYYNEITVPKGQDVIGSYYMANGFAQGYFGMQVNSEKERRVLFSVWSPFHTDNPKEIPDDQKIILKEKGEGVQTGEFGNEGSGGQSFLRYNWTAGNTYGFLLRGRPAKDGYTEFTAWFYAPEEGSWRLIAQFLRPKISTYLKGFHSFLENFIPARGNRERRVLFSNQWVRTVDGNWHECTDARFTADATARKGYRMDYGGGTAGNDFYLRNCGFFNDYTPIDARFSRPGNGKMPNLSGIMGDK